ncbi:hypothetical protein F5Y15DRAFT_428472 [Xylariaceae sp. FL0016]|nr:hypothetical protein F5Y15DRAFT_428472 [Xylariaceae sp. FL0016]
MVSAEHDFPTVHRRRARHVSLGETRKSSTTDEEIPRLPNLEEMMLELRPLGGATAAEGHHPDTFKDAGLFDGLDAAPFNNNTADKPVMKIANIGDTVVCPHNVISGRLPIRLKRPERLEQLDLQPPANVGGKIEDKARGIEFSEQPAGSDERSLLKSSDTQTPGVDSRAVEALHLLPTSKVPCHWIEHILETSIEWRTPSSSRVDYKVQVFVHEGRESPNLLHTYPDLRSALQDICDRLLLWYSSTAAINKCGDAVFLYQLGLEVPKNRMDSFGHVLFDLKDALRYWVDPPSKVSDESEQNRNEDCFSETSIVRSLLTLTEPDGMDYQELLGEKDGESQASDDSLTTLDGALQTEKIKLKEIDKKCHELYHGLPELLKMRPKGSSLALLRQWDSPAQHITNWDTGRFINEATADEGSFLDAGKVHHPFFTKSNASMLQDADDEDMASRLSP